MVVAGGIESMSLIPMGGHKIAPNPTLLERYPDSYLGMGLTAELVAKKYGIDREASDTFSLRSHQKAVAAIEAGKFKDEIVPLRSANGDGRRFETDEGPRKDTSLDVLAKLKPAFAAGGIVTAGNASQMSDGAAATVVMSAEKAKELGVTAARPASSASRWRACRRRSWASDRWRRSPRRSSRPGLKLADIDLVELNEAFACQALAVIQAVGLDPDKVNVNGGAVALGHPLGCTGAKLTAQILHEMARRKARYGVVTMCVGGGMGAAGIFERM